MGKHIIIDKSNNVVLRGFPLKNSYSLYLDYHFKGKRYREFLKLHISKNQKRTAQDKEIIRLAKKLMVNKIQDLQANYHDEPDFSPKVKDFFPYLNKISSEGSIKPNTRKIYIALKGHINKFDNKSLTFKDINRKWMENFKSYLTKNMKRSTADRYFSAMVTILNKAVNEGIIKVNPANGIKRIGKDKNLPKFLTIDELKLLINTPMENDNVKNAFLFSCLSSLRLSDIKNLKWENIVKNGNKTYLNFIQVKTGAEENNPLSPQAVKFLGRRKKPNEYIFKLPADEPIRRSLKKWAKRAGINKDISFHWARHTYGTLLVQSGVDIYTASKLMGHSSVNITAIYAKVLDKGKEDAVLKLPML
jgi:integrase